MSTLAPGHITRQSGEVRERRVSRPLSEQANPRFFGRAFRTPPGTFAGRSWANSSLPRSLPESEVDAFATAGGNFIDTSSNYTNGSAESFVGDFVSADRDYWVIATKYTLRRPGSEPGDLNAGGNSRKNMTRTVEASLRRLNTDHIDLLYLHMWDYATPVEEVMRGLDDLARAGKILYAGISDTPAWVAARAQTLAELRGTIPLVAYQGAYNLVERGIEADVLTMTRALGMGVLAFDLLGGGAPSR